MAIGSLSSLKGANLKSLNELHVALIRILGSELDISTHFDVINVEKRLKGEGESFLTISLPAFNAAFERSLALETCDPDLFVGFRRKGRTPQFLGGFLDRVFDRESGDLLDDPDVDAIQAIRQICLFAGKVEGTCTPVRESRAYSRFVEIEKELEFGYDATSAAQKATLRSVFDLVFGQFAEYCDAIITEKALKPQHGPGATADRLKGNRKYDQRQWTTRLESIFPMGEYAFPNWRSYMEIQSEIEFLEPGDELPLKVVGVPKTAKTPRIIAIEPTCMQYMQQAVRRVIENGIRKYPLVRAGISYESQVPNQEAALRGSIDGTLATLDLSEASDRVSFSMVTDLFQLYPALFEALSATRSTHADVPEHGIIPIQKFASMGSALCFPVESIVFLTICYYGIAQELGRPLSQRDLVLLSGKVRVYGDDIIIPVEYVSSVVRALEAFGLKVNDRKSFWTGKFRESCGKDYYAGTDVSIVRARTKLPSHRQHVREIVSTMSMRNQFYIAGRWGMVRLLDDLLEGIIPVPAVSEDSGSLGKRSFLPLSGERLHSDLQYPIARGMRVQTTIPESPLDGWSALMKFFLSHSGEEVADLFDWSELTQDENHLLRAGRSVSAKLKYGWVRVS